MALSRIAAALAATSAILALAAGSAEAAGLANRQQSATGMGFAYAGAGTSAFGLGSMFWNPAAITGVPGRNSEWNVTAISADRRTTPESMAFTPVPAFTLPASAAGIPLAGSGAVDQFTIAPATYNAFQVNEWLWLGLQTGSPFGSTGKPDAAFAGRVYGWSTKARATAITPTVGIRVNDWLSVGFGITLQQFNVQLRGGDPRWLNALAVTPPPLRPALVAASQNTLLKGDNIGVGFTAGVTLRPWAGGEISLGYRSAIRHSLEGELLTAANRGETLIRANVNLPEIVTLGIKQDLNAQWTVTGTAQFTNWSRLGTVPITNRVTGAPISGLGFRYRDEYFFSVGAEYRPFEGLMLRGGVGYEVAPVTNSNRGVRVLDSDRIWLSLGAGYRFSNRFQLDVSYSHLLFDKGRVDIQPGHPNYAGFTYRGRSEGSANIFSLSLKYRWDEPPTAQPVIKRF